MKYRIFAVLVLSVLVLNLGGSTFADSKVRKGGSELVSLLPASDGVVILDARRAFNDALPKLLSSNQPMLAKITGEIDNFQSRFGIDIRQFESVAAGVTARKIGEKKYDMDPVVIARGQASSASLIAGAKAASAGKFTEERISGKIIYIFKDVKLASDTVTTKRFSGDVALTAVDSTTLAFGTPARVRQAVEAKTKVDLELTSLLDRSGTAVTSFASKVPPGLKSFVPMENDELGRNIDSIQYVYGNADVAGDLASIHVTARTLQNAQAKSLHETLEGLQMLGKAFLGGSKAADKQVYSRMIGAAKFSLQANEVTLDLQVPQSDIDLLVSSLKPR